MQDAEYMAKVGDWVASPYADEDCEIAWRPCKVASVSAFSVVIAWRPGPGSEIFERFEHGDVRPIRWYGNGRRRTWKFNDEGGSADA